MRRELATGLSRSAPEMKGPSQFNSRNSRSRNSSHMGGCHEVHSQHNQGHGLWRFPVS